jgi:hypothetical protein
MPSQLSFEGDLQAVEAIEVASTHGEAFCGWMVVGGHFMAAWHS